MNSKKQKENEAHAIDSIFRHRNWRQMCWGDELPQLEKEFKEWKKLNPPTPRQIKKGRTYLVENDIIFRNRAGGGKTNAAHGPWFITVTKTREFGTEISGRIFTAESHTTTATIYAEQILEEK